jgi:hypothetical protein
MSFGNRRGGLRGMNVSMAAIGNQYVGTLRKHL